jgi:hypothetical protein
VYRIIHKNRPVPANIQRRGVGEAEQSECNKKQMDGTKKHNPTNALAGVVNEPLIGSPKERDSK